MTHIRIGIPTGHIRTEAIRIYQKVFPTLTNPEAGLRCTSVTLSPDLIADFYILSPHDMGWAVASRHLNFAITGSDILEEQKDDMDLGAIRVLPTQSSHSWRIALIGKTHEGQGVILSEYPHITRRHFPNAKVKPVRGSAEGWPMLLQYPAVTVIDTGNTAKQHGLEILQTLETGTPALICHSTDADNVTIQNIINML